MSPAGWKLEPTASGLASGLYKPGQDPQLTLEQARAFVAAVRR